MSELNKPVAMLERDPTRGILRVKFTDEVTDLSAGTYPLYVVAFGLSQGDGFVTGLSDVDESVPVPAAGANEVAAAPVNLGSDGTEHDRKAAAPTGPHGTNATRSKTVLHLKTQRNQPHGSERRCCEECGTMIWGNIPIKDGGRYTDEPGLYESPPAGYVRCRDVERRRPE